MKFVPTCGILSPMQTTAKKNAQKSAQKFKVKKGVNGLGLFSTSSWKKGDKLIEYVGEIITVEEADRRGGKYLFELDKKYTVDGKSRSNIARYVNHSCVPNAEAEIDGKRIFVYALKKIEPGDEVTYNYGKEYFDEYIKPKGCMCPKHAAATLAKQKRQKKVSK
jgi:SET domain-containing protein